MITKESPILNLKGRPSNQRLTGAGERRPQGDGGRYASAVTKRSGMSNQACGECREQWHDRRNSPKLL
ncbi:hypothetical protein H2248_012268 [Termitomyces sp. 'cryptogamus']|nr:hypothetical protein H2248_012268 [Termitomyces sp. 'cryptogamus']